MDEYMNEAQLHQLVVSNVPSLKDLKRTTHDKFCAYDAENDSVVVEYKCRRKFYKDSTQLEKKKYDANMQDKRSYLYIVYDGKEAIHIWNCSWLSRDDYDFNWHTKLCPQTTDFSHNDYVEKLVGELKWKDALHKIKVVIKNKNQEETDSFSLIEGLEI